MADIDFKVGVQVETTGEDKIDQLEKQIEKLKSSKVTLDFDISNNDISKYFKDVQREAEKAGKQAANSFQRTFKSVKFNGDSKQFIKDYLKNMDEIRKKATQYAKEENASKKDALKATQALYKEEEKLAKSNQKTLDSISSKHEKSILDAKKREEKAILAQNKAINKAQEDAYRQQIKQRTQIETKATRQLETLKKNLQKTLSNSSYADSSEVKKAKDLLQKMNATKVSDFNDPIKRMTELESQLKSIQSQLESTHKTNLDNINKQIKAEEKNLKQIKLGEDSQKRIFAQQQIAEMKAKTVQKNARHNELVQQGKDNIAKWTATKNAQNSYYDKLEESQKRIAQIQNTIKADEFKGKYEETTKFKNLEDNLSKINALKERITSEISKGTSMDIDKINADLKTMNSLVGKSETAFNDLLKPVSRLDAELASERTKAWLKSNTKAVKELGEEFNSLAEKQRNATTKGELEAYQKDFSRLTTTAKMRGLTGRSWSDDFKRGFKQIAQFTGTYGVLQNVMQDLPREMVTAVRDINKAQIELTKVTNAPKSQLNAYWEEAANSAKKYGATISDVIQSTADWSRLGYNLDEAKKLSDATTLLQKVGDNMTQESASKGIISTLKGFSLESSEVSRIIDVVNQIANTQPIDTSGIFEGLERSASSLSASNNTLEESISLITAANSVVQDPASVGTAFKTISMRLRGAKTEMEKAGLETDGMIESVSKLREEVKALSGVDIMEDDDTFKSTYKVLDELSTKWKDLTDIQQASLTELIAGKRQGNVVEAVLSNFDIARESLNSALHDSTGSAERELENWNKGIEASIGRFKASFQDLSNTTLDSGFLTGFVDTGAGLLNFLDSTIEKFGVLKSLLAVGGGIFAQKNGLGKRNAIPYKVKQNIAVSLT